MESVTCRVNIPPLPRMSPWPPPIAHYCTLGSGVANSLAVNACLENMSPFRDVARWCVRAPGSTLEEELQ
jgi:hypothetical protein